MGGMSLGCSCDSTRGYTGTYCTRCVNRDSDNEENLYIKYMVETGGRQYYHNLIGQGTIL